MSKKIFACFFAIAIIAAMVSGWALGSVSAVDYIFTNSHGDLTISTDTMISDCENSAYSYSPDNTLFFKSSCKIFYTNSDTYGEINQYYDYVHMFYINNDAQISVSETNGVYTFTSDTRFRYQNYGYAWRESTNGQYYFADNPGYRSDWHNNDWCYTIIYDSNNNTITCDNSDMFPAVHYFGDTYDLQSLSASWDIGDNHHNSDGLNISVVFRPEFSGTVNRATTLSNGNIDYLDNFNFDVTNNSTTAIQWCMAIVDTGTDVSFDVADETRGADRVIHSNNIHYVYISQEDVYLRHSVGSYTDAKGNSSFHYAAANGGYCGYNFVKWDMVDLTDNTTYDVVVYAMPINADMASFVSSDCLSYSVLFGDCEDFTQLQEVYRSTFTMKNPAVFNSNSSYHGTIANNGNTNYDTLARTLYSYTELGDGNGAHTVYGNFTYGQDFASGSYTSVTPDKSYNKLLSETNGVFRFFSSVLSMFPVQVLAVLNLALWSMLIIFIIRRFS